MKKEGYNLSMSEILNSIRSDIFSDRNSYNYNDYDQNDYKANSQDTRMSFSDNDNENPNENIENSSDDLDDADILELDDSFLESQEEEFDISPKKIAVNDFADQDFNDSIKNDKVKKSKKIDYKPTKTRKTSDLKPSTKQEDMSDEVDNFLKLIEESDSDLTFDGESTQSSSKSIQKDAEQNLSSDTDILTALSKADELIQKSEENSYGIRAGNSSYIDKKRRSINDTIGPNLVEGTQSSDKTSNESNPSIMSDAVKKASMKSIYKIIETQKKIQNEKRQTIDDLAMAALIPMLQNWMDQNLAKIVEKVVEKEISKLINTDN